MTNPSKPSGELVHYGVKGMKWGVRRAEANARNSNYSSPDRRRDSQKHGKGGVRRINKRMNKGQKLNTARNNEVKFVKRRQKALAVGIVGARIAMSPTTRAGFKALWMIAGDVTAHTTAKRAETKRGEAWVRNSFAESNGLRGVPKATKKKRGAYNISSL